jgi:hypothetical protein
VVPVREEPTGAQLESLRLAAESAAAEKPPAHDALGDAITAAQQDVTKGAS